MSSRVTEVVSTAQDVIRLLAETGDARLLGFAEALSTWIDGAPFEAALGLTPNWRKPDRKSLLSILAAPYSHSSARTIAKHVSTELQRYKIDGLASRSATRATT